ncbi:DUF2381 family protein [Archangium lansingense]|uniref:DUF2381 family protein n=1 Tax=Archangium lansingense TaxID=2995310 RepID=A0ABT4A645_9BACT|nr:DUF2381 family protein [Archangium lansinium]MCY1076806.1 DUF2381 family protein [Archangium lansinium]
MRTPSLIRCVPFLVLLAPVAQALEPDARTEIRTLFVSDHPAQEANNIYVSGQVSTVLRFEQECDPARTKLLGWEGRFERPLVGSKKVVLEPLRDLDEDERIPLLVTLADGTELAFLLRPPRRETWSWTDHQVNVFKDHESYKAVLSALNDSRKRELKLSQENERLKQEENSVDHAFATLLVNGQVEKTPFRRERVAVLKDGETDITIELFSGPGKAATVVHLTNTYDAPWRFRNARLTADLTSHTARPFALRMERPELVPGQSGRIAVVADESAFMTKEGLVNLALEIFREDGLMEVLVNLDHALIRK